MMIRSAHAFVSSAVVLLLLISGARAQVAVDLSGYREDCEVRVRQMGQRLLVSWPMTDEESGLVTLNVSGGGALFEQFATRRRDEEGESIFPEHAGTDPAVFLTIGTREMPSGKPPDQKWQVFFDNPHRRPHRTEASRFELQKVRVIGFGSRATLVLETLTVGPFRGAWELSFFAGSRLMRVDAVVSTQEDGLAMFYDAGLLSKSNAFRTSWVDTEGRLQQGESASPARPENVRHRAIFASGNQGTLACFPPPHQFQFPRDYSTNLGFVWHGQGYLGQAESWGFGIRQNKDGGGNFVPWFNAPPEVQHRLGMFLLLTSGSAEDALAETLRYTHGDRFVELPGYQTLTSHWHMAIAVTAMQERQRGIQRTEPPEYARMFREMGVNLVHLGEFHGDGHPRDPGPLRLPEMQAMFEECRRWSDDKLLLIPGEEANVHLGLSLEGKHPGHWMYLFPRPVYWTMVRAAQQPFVEEHPQYGKVYHVGNRAEMIRLLKEERGLAWAAHPRIKASSWTPDIFRNEDFFIAEYWLGGAWKAMPGDLSRPKLGERVLDLLDDMANWGHKKYVLGEVDVFKIDHTHELYAHMNVNYVQLDRAPRYDEGWQSVLDALSGGRFFVTTGEVLVPRFTVGGKSSGENLKLSENPQPELQVDLRWTFPLAFAEIISGDGQQVYRERVDLSDTKPFGQRTFTLRPQLAGRRWVRFEVWDIAVNGAFTQPVWLE
jgi:hypothetical protein